MTPIENTTAADPLTKLMVAAPAGGLGILAQEAAGQSQVVSQDTEWVQIPWVNNIYSNDPQVDQQLRDMGFELGDQCTDELWRLAKLPQGWSFSGTSHSMWSRIVDADGFERISIFYKAAFYDRSAHLVVSAVPKTAAQEEAISNLYDEGWNAMYPSVERIGDEVAVISRPAGDYETPVEERTKRRRVVFAKDGTVTYDEKYDVTTEQALEDARL